MYRQLQGGLGLLDPRQLPIFSAQFFQLDSKADPPFPPHFLRASPLSQEGGGGLQPSHGLHYWLGKERGALGPKSCCSRDAQGLTWPTFFAGALGLWGSGSVHSFPLSECSWGGSTIGMENWCLGYSRTLSGCQMEVIGPRGHQRVCLVPGQQAAPGITTLS